MADAHKNFAYSTVATAPSPATSGTSLVVETGDGALFPAAPFNATVWPAGAQPLSTNAEIVRVTARSTDTLTITRSQESSSARSIVTGDQIAASITAKTLTDAELNSGTSFPGSPSDGDLFYRTDRGIIYRWNNTASHWLSIDRKYVAFGTGLFLEGGPGAVTGYLPLYEDMYIDVWSARTLVFTNNGSNFWTVTLNKTNSSNTQTSIASFTTSADTASTWVSHDTTVGAVIAASSFKLLQLNYASTGTPSDHFGAHMLVVRSVG